MDARSLKGRIGAAMAHPLCARLFRPLTRRRATIFMLHRMEDPQRGVRGHSPQLLRALLARLRRERYRIISLDDLFTALEEDRDIDGICFTLDDGYAEQAEIAGRLFAEFDVPATFFLISGFLDRKLLPWDMQAARIFQHSRRSSAEVTVADGTLHLDLGSERARRRACEQFLVASKRMAANDCTRVLERLAATLEVELAPAPDAGFEPMGWEQARSLERRGFRFGPHSASHRILARMSAAEVFREISESVRRLQEELAHPLDVFCFPTGRYSDFGEREVCILQQLGMRGALSAEPGYATARGPNGRRSRFHLRRFALPSQVHQAMHCCAGIERAKELVRAPLAWRA